jgi:hypothetical protein
MTHELNRALGYDTVVMPERPEKQLPRLRQLKIFE